MIGSVIVRKRGRITNRVLTLVICVLVLSISSGYAILNTNLFINGQVNVIFNNFKVFLFGENVSFNPSVSYVPIDYNETIEIQLIPEEGNFLEDARCTMDYLLKDVISGIDSYSKTQDISIDNNKKETNAECYFYYRKLKAQEAGYDKNSHPELLTVKDALDYLYDALGYERVTLESTIILYDHEGHPEFVTVKDALDYLYNKLIG